MEDPRTEIEDVVKGLVRAKNATEQRDIMQRYFCADVSFDHPLAFVPSSEMVCIHTSIH